MRYRMTLARGVMKIMAVDTRPVKINDAKINNERKMDPLRALRNAKEGKKDPRRTPRDTKKTTRREVEFSWEMRACGGGFGWHL